MSNTRSTGRLKSIIAYSISQPYGFGIVTISTLVLTCEGKNLGSLTFPIKIIIFHLVKSLPHPNPKEKLRFRYLFNCTLCRIYSIPQSRIIKTIPSAHINRDTKPLEEPNGIVVTFCRYLSIFIFYFIFLVLWIGNELSCTFTLNSTLREFIYFDVSANVFCVQKNKIIISTFCGIVLYRHFMVWSSNFSNGWRRTQVLYRQITQITAENITTKISQTFLWEKCKRLFIEIKKHL